MKKRINISLDDKTLYIIDNLAEDRGLDRSSMIALIIREKDMNTVRYCDDYDSNRD